MCNCDISNGIIIFEIFYLQLVCWLHCDLFYNSVYGSDRREREEIERQRAAAAYQKAHAEGRTDQARADLARLAIIRQQREDAAKRREAEKQAKEGGSAKK